MTYLLDTVSIIRHFAGIPKIGAMAKQILSEIESGKSEGVISVISLMEIMYLAEKKRIQISLPNAIKKIESSSNYHIIDLTSEILITASRIRFPELHDRLIIATARYLDIPIISSDTSFKQIDKLTVIWD